MERSGSIGPRVAAEIDAPIWLVTRGAQRVTRADTVSPVQSCLWGFGRTASFELPRLWGGLADMAAGAPTTGRVDRPHPRGAAGRRPDRAAGWRRVLRPGGPAPGSAGGARSNCDADATYLVTGGLGAVGLEIAEYLAAHGAGNLVLTGRRPPSDAALARIDAIREQYGCDGRGPRRRRRRPGRRRPSTGHHPYGIAAAGRHRACRR